jgi:hypothetical protein
MKRPNVRSTPSRSPTVPLPGKASPPTDETFYDLTDLAGAHGDEHVIKLTEAAIREYRISEDQTLLAAAERFRSRVPDKFMKATLARRIAAHGGPASTLRQVRASGHQCIDRGRRETLVKTILSTATEY